MVKPTFMCIGVQKAGTTSLINYMNEHPNIYMRKRESHFFDKPKENNQMDIEEYEKMFETDKTIVGEKTPSYCFLQYAIDRIYVYNPNIKLILILREPISRAYSQYNMEVQRHNKDNQFNKTNIMCEMKKELHVKLSDVKKNGNYFIIRGFYDEIIEYILSKFKKEQFLICISEEIRENKQKYYNEIFDFLGAERLDNIRTDMDTHIRKYTKPIPNKVEKKLHKIYKSHNENLYKILGRRIEIWEKYYDEIQCRNADK
jgi:hypothetical protein